jgi:gliding motility-associated-like protein
MARRNFTPVLALFVFIFTFLFVRKAEAQVTFALSPTSISPSVGDTVKFDVIVTNFDSIQSFQYSMEWDPLLFAAVANPKVHDTIPGNLPNSENFDSNPVGMNSAIIFWFARNNLPTTIPNGRVIYRLKLRVLAPSTNYWVRFSNVSTSIEIFRNDESLSPGQFIFGSAGNPPGSINTPVTAVATSQTVAPSARASVAVTAQNFTSISSATWQTKWDSSVLRFDSIRNYNTTLGLSAANFNISQAVINGRMQFTWAAASGGSNTISSSDTLYKIYFTAIGANNTSSSVAPVTSTAVVNRAGVGGTFTQVGLNATAGMVNIRTPTSNNLQFYANHVSGSVGDTVCVKFYTKNFSNIAGLSWSMHWDSTKYNFVKLATRNAAFTLDSLRTPGACGGNQNDLFICNPSSGSATFIWLYSQLGGVTFTADSTLVLELCLRVVGGTGETNPVRIDGIPVSILVLDGDVNNITSRATFSNGSITVVGNTPVTLASAITNVSCNAGSDGRIQLTPSGGTGVFTYAWTGSLPSLPATATITGLVAGTYRVTVTSGVSIKTDTFVVSQPTALGATPTLTNINCFGQLTGAIIVNVSGGTPGYTYRWSNDSVTARISNLASGSYTVTITDTKLCSLVRTYTLTQPTAALGIGGTPTVTNVNCKRGLDGTIAITVSGGTSPYTYSWTGPNSFSAQTQNLTSLRAGFYNVTVTDALQCAQTLNAISVTEPDSVRAGTATILNARCDLASGSITMTTPTGGIPPYSYAWNGPTPNLPNAISVANLLPGTYSLQVRDSKNCPAEIKTFVISNVPTTLALAAASITNATCGQSNGRVRVSVSGGTTPYVFAWTGTGGYTSAAADSITSLPTGTYNLTVTDALGCTKVTQGIQVINENVTIAVTSQNITNVGCNNGADGTISITVSGGVAPYLFTWTGPNGFTSASQNLTGLRAGSYSLRIRDAQNCNFDPPTFSVSQPDALSLGTASSQNILCKGASTGAINITVSGGTAPYSFAWTGPNGFTNVSQNLSGLFAGAYRIVLTDAKNCSANNTITLTEPTDSLKITNPISTRNLCFGDANGTINVTVAGGTPQYRFSWSGPSGFLSSSQNLTSLRAGSYRLTVLDANNCSVESQGIVVSQPLDSLRVSPTVVNANNAANGSITLQVSGGTTPYSYNWSGQGVSPAAQNQSNLCNGTYSVTVTDANNCRKVVSIEVGGRCATDINLASVTTTSAGCPGQNLGSVRITVSGGTQPYTYSWFNALNVNVGTSANLDNQPAGNYTVRITDAAGASYTSQPITISGSQTGIGIQLQSISPETCAGNDGSIVINVSGGAPNYSYVWNNGATSKDLFNVRAGNYAVTVSDANNCIQQSLSYEVRRNNCPLIAVKQNEMAVRCFGDTNGSVTIDIQNGEPSYVIRWSPRLLDSVRLDNATGRRVTYTITGLAAGAQTVSIRDIAGQTLTISVNIGSPLPLVASPSISQDNGTCNGSIILNPAGGTPPFTILWNDGITTADRFNLCGGVILRATITDRNGCVLVRPYDTIQRNLATLRISTANITDPQCASDSLNIRNGVDITLEGGVAPYTFVWRNSLGAVVSNQEDLTGARPGRYSVSITDNSRPTPQTLVREYEIKVRSDLRISEITTVCDDGASNGTATIIVAGGQAPYRFLWCDGVETVTNSRNNLRAGACSVVVTDAANCSVTRSFSVSSCKCMFLAKNPDPLKNGFDIKCAGKANDGSASVRSVSADYVRPYSFRWSSGETGEVAFRLSPGVNSVTLTDANGKTCTETIQMTTPSVLSASILCNDAERSALVQPQGGVLPYRYTWSQSNSDTASKIVSLPAGRVFVLVRDRNGCEVMSECEIKGEPVQCLKASTVITPNDDARNDIFQIENCNNQELRLEVYNRWGQLVYQKDNYTNTWEGRTADGKDGKSLPEGVYFFVIKATGSNGKVTIEKGYLNILRGN